MPSSAKHTKSVPSHCYHLLGSYYAAAVSRLSMHCHVLILKVRDSSETLTQSFDCVYRLRLSKLPAYDQLLLIGKGRTDGIYLDLGCCCEHWSELLNYSPDLPTLCSWDRHQKGRVGRISCGEYHHCRYNSRRVSTSSLDSSSYSSAFNRQNSGISATSSSKALQRRSRSRSSLEMPSCPSSSKLSSLSTPSRLPHDLSSQE